jgi:hypothetical protein
MESAAPTDNTWHQQPWIWFVIGLLAVTMMASFAMLFIAMKNAPELVVENYSNIEEYTEQTRARDKRAAELELAATVYIDGNQLAINLQAAESMPWPDSIVVRTVNSTLAALDSQAVIYGSQGSYVGTVKLPNNAYYLHIEDPDGSWRLSQRAFGKPKIVELRAFEPGLQAQ